MKHIFLIALCLVLSFLPPPASAEEKKGCLGDPLNLGISEEEISGFIKDFIKAVKENDAEKTASFLDYPFTWFGKNTRDFQNKAAFVAQKDKLMPYLEALVKKPDAFDLKTNCEIYKDIYIFDQKAGIKPREGFIWISTEGLKTAAQRAEEKRLKKIRKEWQASLETKIPEQARFPQGCRYWRFDLCHPVLNISEVEHSRLEELKVYMPGNRLFFPNDILYGIEPDGGEFKGEFYLGYWIRRESMRFSDMRIEQGEKPGSIKIEMSDDARFEKFETRHYTCPDIIVRGKNYRVFVCREGFPDGSHKTFFMRFSRVIDPSSLVNFIDLKVAPDLRCLQFMPAKKEFASLFEPSDAAFCSQPRRYSASFDELYFEIGALSNSFMGARYYNYSERNPYYDDL